MRKRQAIPYCILLIAFLIWLYLKPQKELSALPEHHPSFIAYNINNSHFNETGEVTHQIYATKATNYNNENITVFEHPKVVIYIKNKKEKSITTWQIKSEKGILSDENKLVLSGDVWVKNLSLDQLIQTINTERLTILLAEKELSSEVFIYWKGPQMEQQGIGMWASLVSEELIVKKQIKAIYLNENK
ncbi:MAG: LPS export ABC transporter periplasmic protein LptC [Psychromonas sp.]